MNWVGGSRNRFMMRNDLKKQREYFEKRKMQSKMKLPLEPSPRGSGSVDLVTLFIVNQIAAKKENSERPKITHLNHNNGCVEPLELPMSPCSPSHLSLVESQPHYSFQGIRKRKHPFPGGFRCQQLSPVLESNLSDNSASDYQLAHIADTLSPFSTSSSASSSGLFPLQLRGQTQSQRPPQPWGGTSLEKAQFRPYSQPSGRRESSPWGSGPNGSQRDHQPPSLSRGLFGSADPHSTGTRDKDVHAFSLLQHESEELPQEEELFRGFSSAFRSDAPFGKEISKISLKADSQNSSSIPPDVTQSHSIHPGLDSVTQLSDCADITSSCLQQNLAYVDCGGSSPRYTPRGGYFSSESDDEHDCHQCVQEQPPSLPAQHRPDKNLSVSQASPWSPAPAPSQLSPGSRSRGDPGMGPCSGLSQRRCNCAGTSCSQTDRSGHDRAGSLITARRKIASPQTRDMGTQTVLSDTFPTSEASTQCSLELERSANTYPVCRCHTLSTDSKQFGVAADSVVPTHTCRGQSSPRDGALTHDAQPDSISRRLEEEGHMPWRRVTTAEDETRHLSIRKPLPFLPESRVSVQRPDTPILRDEPSRNVTESDKQMDEGAERVEGAGPAPAEREEGLITNLAEEGHEATSENQAVRREPDPPASIRCSAGAEGEEEDRRLSLNTGS